MSKRFDPMTGELLEDDVKFDPMTGEPVKTSAGFDPMTGEPVNATTGFDPMTGQPISAAEAENKKKKPKWLAFALIALVAVGVVFMVVKSGLFMSKANKVLLATANTFTAKSHLMKDLDISSIIAGGNYTVDISGDVDDSDVNMKFQINAPQKQMALDMNLSVDAYYDTFDVEASAYMDKELIQVKVPMLSDDVITYNFQKKCTGYLAELAGEDEIQEVNDLLASVFDTKDNTEFSKKMVKALKKEYYSLKFQSVSKKSFSVNNKERNCKGYKTTITSDNVDNVLDTLSDLYDEYYDEYYDVSDLALDYSENPFKALKSELRGTIDEADVIFYIYKNTLACISIEIDDEVLEIQFRGGDTPMQNMKIKVDRDTLLEVKGSTASSEEKTRIIVGGETLGDIRYNYKTGKLSVSLGEGTWDEVTIEGKIESKNNSFTIQLEEVYIGDMSFSFNGKVGLTKGTSIKKIKGTVFDLGSASEDDLYEWASALQYLY